MGMPRFGVCCRARFDFGDARKWFTNPELVAEAVAAVVECDFAEAFTYGGKYGDAKPIKRGASGLAKALTAKSRGSRSALDAPTLGAASLSVALDYDVGGFEATLAVADDVLAPRAESILDSLQTFVFRLVDAFRPHGGFLSNAHITPDGGEFRGPHPRPPVWHPLIHVTSLIGVFDEAFQQSGLDDADPDTFARILNAPLPSYATRTRRNGLVVVRFHHGPVELASVALAAGRHGRWLARTLSLPPMPGYNTAGDADQTPRKRVPRAPFAFFDPNERRAYEVLDAPPEALIPIEELPTDVKEVRLVVPHRELALAVNDRARSAGYGAVLYSDERDRLWNVTHGLRWIDDEDPEPVA